MIGEISALATALCWAISAIFYKKALQSTSPFSANIIRCLFTSVVMISLLGIVGNLNSLFSLPLNFVILAGFSGIIGLGLGDTLYMLSLNYVGVFRAVSITSTYPLFALLFSFLMFGKLTNFSILFGTVTVVIGIWLISRGSKKGVTIARGKLFKGILCSVLVATLWAVSILMIDLTIELSFLPSLEYVWAINTIRMIFATVVLLMVAPVTEREFHFIKMNLKTVFTLGVGGVIALTVGWFLLTISLAYIPESQAIPISSTTPLFAALLGIAFLQEQVNTKNVLGSFLIVLGISLLFII